MTDSGDNLISLNELGAVLGAYAGPPAPRTRRLPRTVRRRMRPVLVAAVAATALALTGVAIAASVGAFSGISAANHPQTSTDQLDNVMANMVALANGDLAAVPGDPDGQIEASASRLIGQLANGANVYVMPTTTDKLCIVRQTTPGSVEYSGIMCLDPLTQTAPTTLESTMGLTYGVARDDVASISFNTPSGQVTVPVKNNVWSYEGDGVDLSTVTITFSDGSTEPFTQQ